MQKWEVFGKREYEEDMLGQVGGGGPRYAACPPENRRGRHADLGYCASAPKVGVWDRDREGFIISKGDRKNNIYFKMDAKTFTFPVLVRYICWSLSSTDASICHDSLLATNSPLLWINL